MKSVSAGNCMVIICGIILGCQGLRGGDGSNEIVKLADPDTTVETANLYHNMKQMLGHGIMFGHQDTLAYGVYWKSHEFDSDVYQVCGDYPAVFGWDIGHIGDKANIDGVSFAEMKQWIEAVYRRGGINTVSWHARHPDGGSAWTTKRVVHRLLDGGDLHEAFLEKLDQVAAFFLSLKGDQGEPIPIIFRPYHEQSGGWFWWGTATTSAEEYQQLWRMTVRYLRDKKQVHNLLYCFSPDVFKTEKEYLKTWPGDEWVDIMALDDYYQVVQHRRNEQAGVMLDMLVKMAREKNKIPAVSETGLETVPDATWWTGALWQNLTDGSKARPISWVLVWRNGRPDHYFGPFVGQKSAEDFKKFESEPQTLFLKDLKGTYQ